MAIVNITCENDADFTRGFIYQTLNDDGSAGPPINLTGNTMRMGIRFRAEDVNQEMLLTTENGGLVITDAPNGKFTVTITQAQLVQLQIGAYEHSLIRMTGAATLRIWSGSLVINPGASR
jgi:diaminopimelate epimerase